MWSTMTPEEQTREIARLNVEYHKGETSDRLKIQESLGTSLLKNLMLMNGGALIALFTFIGNTDAAAKILSGTLLWSAFAAFVTGVVLTAISNASAYLMQAKFAEVTVHEMWNAQAEMVGSHKRTDFTAAYSMGNRFQLVMIATAIGAIVAFCLGAGLALAGVTPDL